MRNRPDNYNRLVEQPTIRALLPDLAGKAVLDMGCGFGANCMDFVQRGAKNVVGIDVSQKMLDAACEENFHEKITYRRMGMEDIGGLDDCFDLVFSSMTVHYAADFDKLIRDVRCILADGGVFLFSQEHPINTASGGGARQISDYLIEGSREIEWLGQKSIRYHRSFSHITNALIQEDFTIINVVEPMPTADAIEIAPRFSTETHSPTSLIIKAV